MSISGTAPLTTLVSRQLKMRRASQLRQLHCGASGSSVFRTLYMLTSPVIDGTNEWTRPAGKRHVSPEFKKLYTPLSFQCPRGIRTSGRSTIRSGVKRATSNKINSNPGRSRNTASDKLPLPAGGRQVPSGPNIAQHNVAQFHWLRARRTIPVLVIQERHRCTSAGRASPFLLSYKRPFWPSKDHVRRHRQSLAVPRSHHHQHHPHQELP